MRKSKLENEQFKQQVVKGLAVGQTKTEIAKEIGLSRSAVSRFSSREDVRQLVEEETYRLLGIIPDAVENIRTLVKGMKDLDAKNHKGRELAFNASKRVLESAGLFSSASPSTQVINIVAQKNVIITDDVTELLRKLYQGTGQHPTIDYEDK